MKLLITSDWHIRSTVPGCLEMNSDQWMDVQRQSLKKIVDIVSEYQVSDIMIGGDIFHSDNTTSFECIQLVQDFAKDIIDYDTRVWVLCGNHDLPLHSSSNLYRSAIGVLLNSYAINNMNDKDSPVKGCNFDIDEYGDSEMIYKHTLTIPYNEIPFEGMECDTPETLLKKYPKAKWIFTGDYHRSFEYHLDGRHVINSGCLTKQASDFEDYVCGVYVVDTEKEESKFVPININYTFNHNGYEKKALDERVENFVMGIKKENVTLDYVNSLKNEAQNHEVPIQDQINGWIERSGN